MCEQVVCVQVVCVCKLYVLKLCVRRREAGGQRRADGGGRDTEPKTRTPHKDVGNEAKYASTSIPLPKNRVIHGASLPQTTR